MLKFNIRSIEELRTILSNYKTEEINFIGYAWLEYGFYPIFFNELFKPFFDYVTGTKIGTCLPGQEIFYENLVDVLIVLDGFIDTTRAYSNNGETPLLIENFKKYGDRGIAFWETIKNFNEDEYENVIYSYKYKNILHPIGRTKPWDLGLFSLCSFKYATGEKDFYTTEDTLWRTSGTLGWNLSNWKNYHFEKVFEFEKYSTLFVKNTWKSRNFRSNNLNDFLVGESGTGGQKGWGFISLDLVNDICKYFIENKRHLVVINDLSKYPLINNEFIHSYDMYHYLDVQRFLSIIHNSEVFITSSTSPVDLASYYCDTNIVLIDDKQNKNSFIKRALSTKQRSSFCLNDVHDYFEFTKFLGEARK